jgi:hypothetical protein
LCSTDLHELVGRGPPKGAELVGALVGALARFDRFGGVLEYVEQFEAEQKEKRQRQNRRAAFRREVASLGLASLLRPTGPTPPLMRCRIDARTVNRPVRRPTPTP